MPASARQVIDQLGVLNRLPEGQWRVHAGDVAHGESTDLNDTAWTVAGHQDYAENALWLRQWIEVPKDLHGYDLTDTRIWFVMDASGGNSLSQIVYFNGRRVALGESMEPIVLFDHAKPGDRVLVAVKLLATTGGIHFNGSTDLIDFAANRPNPVDAHNEFLSAAFLVPSLSKDVPADSAILWKAIARVDMKALDSGDQQSFDTSLNASLSTLSALRPLLNQTTVHLTGNAHIDAAWLWPWSESVDTVKRTFSTALQLMNEYPDYTFTQSAAAYNEWLADKYPPLNEAIHQRIQQGRWEVVGGMWVEPDLNLPDGESTARSLLIAKRWYLQQYGVDVHVGWNPDSFGYNWQLPQIYKKSGIDYFVTQKMSWNDTNKLPFKLFWWESPDGSKVLTYFPHSYVNRNMDPARLSFDLVQARKQAPGMTEMMDLYGIGDHGGGPTRAMLEQITHWMEPGKIAPKMEFGTAATYFNTIDKQVAPESKSWNYRTIAQGYDYPPTPPTGQISIPTWKDELYLEYHRGVYTTQAGMKRNLRQGPVWTLDAEKFASLAWLNGHAYPGDALTEDWKKITFNGFHDLAAGSGIAVIYRDAQKDFDHVRSSTSDISTAALTTIAASVDTRVAEGVPVFVFNPLAWSRSGQFTIDVQMPDATPDVSVLNGSGTVLPSEVLSKNAATHTFHLLVEARDVPSVGYEVLHVVPGKRVVPSDIRVSGTTLENAALRVVVDPKTGCITSLYDKRSGFESLAAGSCGNELQAFKDDPK
jgi:alpha-mannosidase